MRISYSFIVTILFLYVVAPNLQAQPTTTNPCPFDIEIITTPPTCPGGDDGTIVILNNTDVGTIHLDWINLGPLPIDTEPDSLTDLSASTYILEVRNEDNCRDTFSILLEDPPPLLFQVLIDSTSCFDNIDGAIEVIPISAKIDLLYYLESSIEPQESPSFTGLPRGTHTVYIETRTGCLYTRTVEIESPPALNLALNITQPCSDNDTGAVEALADGGSGRFRYSLNNSTFDDNERFPNLPPGEYTMYIRDDRGCTNTENFEIEEYIPPAITIAGDDPTCPGATDGKLIVIIEALDALEHDYDFSLNGIDYQADSIFTNLAGGTYDIYIRNENGCIIVQTASLHQPQWPPITINIDHVNCPGASDGTLIVIIEALDIDPNYFFSIDGISFTQDTIFKNLSAGFYTIYLQDGHGCQQNFEVTINEPEAPELNEQTTEILCHGGQDGALKIQTTGGRPPFQFSLDGQNFQSSPNFYQLSGGDYQIYLLDSADCSITKNISISEPPAFDLTFTVGEEACDHANGWVASSLKGGTPPYDYLWSNGSTSSVINHLSAATYTLQIIDQNQCLKEQNVVVKNAPAPLLQQQNQQSPSCVERADGQLEVDVFSDYGPLKYDWSNGAQEAQIQHLASGAYTLTVEDINQCRSVYDFELKAASPIKLSPQFEHDLYGTAVVLEASGGTGPYQYEWSNGQSGKEQEFIGNGSYEVTVVDVFSCSYTFPVDIQNEQLLATSSIEVFPNPTTDWLTIEVALIQESEVQLILYDVVGKLLGQKTYPSVLAQQIKVDLSTLATGQYQLQILQGEQSWSFPIIKVEP